MKVSIDLDGTLWQHMGQFRTLMLDLKSRGYEVGILTLHSESIRAADLALMSARGFPAPDFFLCVPEGHREEGGGMAFKARMIREHSIDRHYDDFDFGNEGSRALLMGSDVGLRVVGVEHRDPHNEHFE